MPNLQTIIFADIILQNMPEMHILYWLTPLDKQQQNILIVSGFTRLFVMYKFMKGNSYGRKSIITGNGFVTC